MLLFCFQKIDILKSNSLSMEENQSILELQVDQTASKNLSDAARWAKFLSITGFICMGLMVIFFMAMQSQITSALSQVIPGFSNIFFF